MPGAPLPTRLLRALRDRSSHPPADRLPHTRNLEQIERLLDRAPVVLGDENSMAALAGDVDRLVGLRGLIEKAVQLFPRLARRHGAHKKLSPALAYAITYASATFSSQEFLDGRPTKVVPTPQLLQTFPLRTADLENPSKASLA